MRLRSLTGRFVLTLLLSAVVPLGVFGWVAHGGMRERMERRIGEVYLPQLAAGAADRIASLLDQTRRGLALLIGPAASALRDPRALIEFEDQAKLLPGTTDDFDLLLLIDGAGAVVHGHFSPRLDPLTERSRLELLPDSVREHDWFVALSAPGAPGEVWQGRHRSPFLYRSAEGRPRDPAAYHLGLALRVAVDGRSAGCVYALVRWQRVQEVLEETVAFLRDPERAGLPASQCFVADVDGTALAHTDRRLYGELLQPAALRDAAVRAATATGEAARQIALFGDDGVDRRAGLASLPASAPPALRWGVGLQVHAAELFASSRDFGRLLALFLGGLVAVLLIWSLVASRAITGPVKTLTAATARLARGELDTRVADRGRRDELGDLSRHFNRMAEELAENQEQLRQAERQTAWAEMARQVAHEIKNPLTPMRLSAQLLTRARRAGDERWPELSARLAKTVLEQTDALARIATDFRQLAGPSHDQREEIAADLLLRDVVTFFADSMEARGVHLQVTPAAPAAQVLVDRQELRRVFINLVQNALEAGDDGSLRRIEIGSAVDGDYVVYTVRDDGPGVPEDVRSRLFEPHFTTKSSGTGLGLAICRRIVEAHGGDIRLQVAAGGETEFVIHLPRLG